MQVTRRSNRGFSTVRLSSTGRLDLGHRRQALLNKSSHHGTAPATVGGATNTVRSDPHLLSIELLNGV